MNRQIFAVLRRTWRWLLAPAMPFQRRSLNRRQCLICGQLQKHTTFSGLDRGWRPLGSIRWAQCRCHASEAPIQGWRNDA